MGFIHQINENVDMSNARTEVAFMYSALEKATKTVAVEDFLPL